MGKKLWSQIPFRLFALYWLLSALVNLVEFVHLSPDALELFTVIYNMLDIPLVLTIISFTTSSAATRKFTRIIVPALLATELVNCFIRGFYYESLKYVLGAGLVIVIGIIIKEIVGKLQKIKHTGQEKGLLLIYAAMLFEYGTYIVIYIFDYFLPGASSTTDNFLVYYLSSLIALTVAICGFLTKGINTSLPATDRFGSSFSKGVPDYVLSEEFE